MIKKSIEIMCMEDKMYFQALGLILLNLAWNGVRKKFTDEKNTHSFCSKILKT